MNKIKISAVSLVFLALLSLIISSCLEGNHNEVTKWQKEINLTGEWKFSIGDDVAWIESGFNDKDWENIRVPSPWENEGFHGYNGYAWYRKHFVIPTGIKNKGLYLNLGVIDDVDEVYINGHLVGATGSFPPNYESAYYNSRNYPLPDEFVKFGSDNLIAVRVFDNELEGGIVNGEVGIYTMKDYLIPDIPLEGLWKLNIGDTIAWKEKSVLDTGWQKVTVPGYWESQGFNNYDGFAWYRKSFFVPKEFKGKKLIIAAGKIDDFDELYVNGTLVGSMGDFSNPNFMSSNQSTWQEFRGYNIPEGVIIPGASNTIAIRVFDGGLGGGIYEGPIGIVTQEKYTKFWRSRKD